MNPQDIAHFAETYLEPRLEALTRLDARTRLDAFVRHDLPWESAAPDAFVCPVEFVAIPIQWIKCSFTLTAPPLRLGREDHVLVGFRFSALYDPGAVDFDIGVNRGHGPLARLAIFRHRWAVGPDAGETVAAELARAMDEQWPAAFARFGTVEPYIAQIKRHAAADVGWLETLAYSHALAGDVEAARQAVARILRDPHRTPEINDRAALIGRLLASSPAAAIDRLTEWRRGRLEAEGLLPFAAKRKVAPVAERT